MPINRPEPPEGLESSVLEMAAEVLPGRLESLRAGRSAREGGAFDDALASTRLGVTRPLYHLGLDRIVDGTGMAAAESIGWRAMVAVEGEEIAYADVGERPEGPEVRQMTYGPVVSGLVRSARDLPENDDDAADVDYDERILQVPGVYLTAIWLHSEADPGADVLIPTSPVPIGVEARRRYSADELLAAVGDLARARLSDDSRAPGTGGGTPPPA